MLDDAAKLLSVGENQSYIQTEAYTTAGQAGLTGWRKWFHTINVKERLFT